MRQVEPRVLLTVLICAAAASAADRQISFSKDIQPVLQATCWKCHGLAVQLSKLDLSSRESALKGGEGGVVLVPGQRPGSEAVDGTVNMLCSDRLTDIGEGACYQSTFLDVAGWEAPAEAAR